MSKRTLVLMVAAIAVGLAAPHAYACWDNSDLAVAKLKKLKLSTEQLKEIFVLQKQHRAVIARAHKEGLGCRYHENHDAVFEKQAIGVLDSKQFKQHVGRIRTKVETLEYDNGQLRKRVEKMEKRMRELEKLIKLQQALLDKQAKAKKK